MTQASSSTLARLSAASLPVWLVDDEADVRDSLSQWLEVSGLEVRTFSRAGKALKTASRAVSSSVISRCPRWMAWPCLPPCKHSIRHLR